jgi:hypothetical protein
MMRTMLNPTLGLPRCLGLWAETKRRSEKPWPKNERSKYFASSLPTNTLIAVSRLAHPDMLVEIEAEAIVTPVDFEI